MSRTIAAAVIALLTVTAPADAATIQWDFSGITPFESVAPITITGIFDFDAASPCCLSSEIPDYNLTLVYNGSTIYNFTPSNSFFETEPPTFVLENNGATITNLQSILFNPSNAAELDGTLGSTINLSRTNLAALFTSAKYGFVDLQLQGQLVEAPVSAVPLPPALPMFGAALLALGGFAWRSRRQQRG
jgi:hypothetical protein